MRNLFLALIAVGLWLISAQVQKGPEPRGAEAAPAQFSAARAMATLARLQGPQRPHPAGSAENAAIHARLRQELAALGLPVEALATRACYSEPRWGAIECADIEDLIVRAVPGEGKAIVLMAHMDSVPAGPGAGDDGSGVATLLETLRALKADAGSTGHPVIALFTDGEEAGLLGAAAFVEDARWRETVGLVINVEGRGSSGQSLLFQTSPGDAALVNLYAHAVPRFATSSLYGEIYKYLPNDTDLTPFLKAKLPGYNFAFLGDVAHYHTALDTIANLDPRSVQSGGDAVLALTRALRFQDFAALVGGDGIYLDIFGVWLPRLPVDWAFPLALLALAVIVGVAWRRRPTIAGLLTPPLFVAVAVVAGFAVKALAGLISGHTDPSYAQPLLFRLALAVSLGALALAAARRANVTACWLWFALFAVASAWALPGLSPYFLFPVLVAALFLPFGNAWMPALAALPIWIQLTAGAEPLMGLGMTPLFTVPAALGLTTVLPLLRFDRRHLLGAAGLGLALTVAAGFVPAYDAQHPQRLNFHYVEAGGRALWVADAVKPLPEAVRGAAAFSPDPQSIGGDPRWQGYVADAGRPRFPPPAAIVRRDGDAIILDLRGSDAADGMTLTIPSDAGLARVLVDGKSLPVNGKGDRLFISCASPGCRTATVTLVQKQTGPLTVILTELRHGLPPGGEKLQAARGALGTPSQTGDAMSLISRLQID
jgi:hypothetical protein